MTLTSIRLDGPDFVFLYPPSKGRKLGREVDRVVLKLVPFRGQHSEVNKDIPDEMYCVSMVDNIGRAYVSVEQLVDEYGSAITSECWYVYSWVPRRYFTKTKDLFDIKKSDQVLEGYWIDEETMRYRNGPASQRYFGTDINDYIFKGKILPVSIEG